MPISTPLPRRTVLRAGAGLAVALPLLQAMMPRRARAAAAPRRLLVWTTPNGTVVDRWVCRPGRDSSDFALSEILSPLERHKRDLIVVQNLSQHGAYGHQYATALTGWPMRDRGYPRITARGISVDQHVAAGWRGRTPLPSLELGVGITDGRDTISSVSWSAPDRPVPPENDPFKLYARLFSSSKEGAGTLGRLIGTRRSILDTARGEITGLGTYLGREDRGVLDGYLESLRAIESQMTALAARGSSCPAPAVGAEPAIAGDLPWWLVTANHPAVLRLQMKIATTALACDLTRVITLTPANAGGYHRHLPWIEGLPRGLDWHALSHMVETGKEEPLVAVELWLYQQLALLIDDLKAVVQPDGSTLLASTLVLAHNEYGPNGPVRFLSEKDNFTHQGRFIPYLLLGQAGGSLRTGRNLVYPVGRDGKGIPQTRLLVSVLGALGFPDRAFGDPAVAQGPLPDLA